MRKRDGKESDLGGGKIACEFLGAFGYIAGYACKMLSNVRSIVGFGSDLGLGYGSTLRRNTQYAIRVLRYPYISTISLLTCGLRSERCAGFAICGC